MNTEKDERKAECPYCKNGLKKVPSAKTKCPACKEFMYVRTRVDGVRAVVTKLRSEEIEKDWRRRTWLEEIFKYTDKSNPAFKAEKNALLNRADGSEPSINDVLRRIFNKQLIEYSTEDLWGLNRNTRFQMGCLLMSEGEDKQGLGTFLEVCYLDLSTDILGEAQYGSGALRKKLLAATSESAEELFEGHYVLAPVVIDWIIEISNNLNIGSNEMMNIHNEHITKVKDNLNIPISLEISWSLIIKEIEQNT